MQWYFLSDTQEQVPVQEDHLAGLVQTGVVRPNTMIWHEGMDEWVACSEEKPELFAQRQVVPVVGAAATARQTAALNPQGSAARVSVGATNKGQMGDGQTIRELASAFASAAIWMKLIGVLFLLGGVVYILMALFVMVTGVSAEGGLVPALILSLITAGVGAIVMWMGILLFQSASKAQEATLTAQKYALISALNQNAKFFKIWGITIAIALLLYGLVVVLAISGVMGTALLSGFGSRGGLEMIESEVPGIEDISPDDQLDEDDMMEDDGLEIMDQNELDDGATEEDSDSN